jgi:hypothetical protein
MASENKMNSDYEVKLEKKDQIEAKALLKGATTLVAALAWNDAAKRIIEYLFPMTLNKDNAFNAALATIIYAVFITIFIIIVITSYNILNEKLQKNRIEKMKKRIMLQNDKQHLKLNEKFKI